jgi:hypothetical protein
MLVFNEVKTYDKRESYADFKLAAGKTPRLFKTAVGDIYTTNKFAAGVVVADVVVGDKFSVTAGLLAKNTDGDMVWKAVKVYTMPDGTPGVKLQRVE